MNAQTQTAALVRGRRLELLENQMTNHHTAAQPAPQDFTESGLADAFVARIHHRVRYCRARKWWIRLSATGWSIDGTDATFDECRAMLAAFGGVASHAEAQRLGRLSTINAALRIARTDRRIAITMNAAAGLLGGER